MDQVVVFFTAIFAYIGCFLLLQLVVFRARRIKELIQVLTLIAFAAGLAVWAPFYFLTESYFPDDWTRGLLAFAGLYGSLGFSGTYIILGPISADRSLSAHICMTMERAGAPLSLDEVKRRYPQSIIFDKRFYEYRDVGVMTEEGGQFQLTAKGRRIAFIFESFLKALKMKENF
ncbi:MAG TPA: hypothetical protein PKC28_09125 [Bdellovibrionales bacterium]|nr:hypothetical protein [Bdellovibrionales bacterium]